MQDYEIQFDKVLNRLELQSLFFVEPVCKRIAHLAGDPGVDLVAVLVFRGTRMQGVIWIEGWCEKCGLQSLFFVEPVCKNKWKKL